MKKLILSLLLLASMSAFADGHRHHQHRGHYAGGNDWLVPVLIGGAIGYVIRQESEPRTVIVQQQQPVVVNPPPYGYHWTQVIDASCNCQRLVLVPN